MKSGREQESGEVMGAGVEVGGVGRRVDGPRVPYLPGLPSSRDGLILAFLCPEHPKIPGFLGEGAKVMCQVSVEGERRQRGEGAVGMKEDERKREGS